MAERTHQMNDRLPWRLFGLIYAHPQPLSPDTSQIRNQSGLSLPADLDGQLASTFLIDAATMAQRTAGFQKVCQTCHSRGWVEGHWAKFENAIKTTNDMTDTSTKIMFKAWVEGWAQGPPPQGSLFDEHLERLWAAQWLFYANSTRLASAMSGADYGVFDNGRWDLSRNLQAMIEWMKIKEIQKTAGPKGPEGKGD